jgi:hypothetical protein
MKRRTFMAAAPIAATASILPGGTASAAVEHPWEKARRLARELSDTLAELRAIDQDGGLCVAVVHPAGQPYACGFADIDSYDEGWAIAREFTREPGWVDPLATAIADYRKGCADFCALPEDMAGPEQDKLAEVLINPPMSVLAKWDMPARSASAAFDALVIAGEEVEFLSEMGKAMFGAVGNYLLQVDSRARYPRRP